MRIIDGIKLKGRPAEIPDCGRNDLPRFFVEMGYKVGAEIGVHQGKYTKKFLDAGLKMYGIDPWTAYKDYNKKYNSRFQEKQDFLYAHTQRYLAKHISSGLCQLVRKTSMDAIEDFENESLDFVYIDGHHSFRYIAEDLCEWSQKVKKGGVVSGHDYAVNKKRADDPHVLQVKYVLHAYTEAFHIDNWYVLGRKSPPGERVAIPDGDGDFYHKILQDNKGEIRDMWRSWMFVRL